MKLPQNKRKCKPKCKWHNITTEHTKRGNTFANSSSGTWSFFCIRTLISVKVSPSRMTKKNGSPKFWICCHNKSNGNTLHIIWHTTKSEAFTILQTALRKMDQIQLYTIWFWAVSFVKWYTWIRRSWGPRFFSSSGICKPQE